MPGDIVVSLEIDGVKYGARFMRDESTYVITEAIEATLDSARKSMPVLKKETNG